MTQTHPTGHSWFLRLVGGRGYLVKGANLLNRMLISSLGVKVVAADSFEITEDWPYRLLFFHKLFGLIENVPGDIVECGVASGSSLCLLAILVKTSGVRRHIWGFDSFEGLPAPSKEDLGSPHAVAKRGMFIATEEDVLHTLRSGGFDEYTIKHQVTLVKGWFSETLPKYEGSIALLRIDADLYESYKTALENLWPKVSVGGIVTFSAYDVTDLWPGARRAVDDYFSQHRGVTIHRGPSHGGCYAVKVA